MIEAKENKNAQVILETNVDLKNGPALLPNSQKLDKNEIRLSISHQYTERSIEDECSLIGRLFFSWTTITEFGWCYTDFQTIFTC